MTDGTPRRPGRPKKYDPAQLKDHGAPKLSIRFDPDLFAFLQEQPGGSRATLEGLVRKEASPIRKLALGLALAVRELPTGHWGDTSKTQDLDEDSLHELTIRSVNHAARLLSFGKDDPDAVVDARQLAITVKKRMERRSTLKVNETWKSRLFSATLNLSLATSEFFVDPAKSDERARNGLDALARAAEELNVPGASALGPQLVRDA